jgi:hypothetical protein
MNVHLKTGEGTDSTCANEFLKTVAKVKIAEAEE